MLSAKKRIVLAPVVAALAVAFASVAFAVTQNGSGRLEAGDSTHSVRLVRNGSPSTCAGKAFPGTETVFGTPPFLYDEHLYQNGPVDACVTIEMDHEAAGTACGPSAHAMAYLGDFDPASFGTGYLGDEGNSINGLPFDVMVPANATLDVVIMQTFGLNGPNIGQPLECDYTFTVDGLTPPAPDLSIQKADTPDPVAPGGLITYELEVALVSLGTTGVRVVDQVPAGTRFVSATVVSGAGWVVTTKPSPGGTGLVMFSKSSMAAGDSATLRIVVRVNNNVALGTVIENIAVIGASVSPGSTNVPAQDPDTSNNISTTTTTVAAPNLLSGSTAGSAPAGSSPPRPATR
jgi:uncharacterized repeat protein (TIGR01451 family)